MGSFDISQSGRAPIALVVSQGEALGDAATRLAAYRAIRAAWPDHRIVSVAARGSAFEGPLEPFRAEFVDQTITHEPRINTVAGFRSLIGELGTVRRIFDLRSTPRAIVSYLGAGGAVETYVANQPGLFLRRGLAPGWRARPKHNYLRYHRMVEAAAGRPLPFDPWLAPLPDAERRAAQLLPGGPYIGLAPGLFRLRKAWPRERFAALAADVGRLGLRPVFLLGLYEADERALAQTAAPVAAIIDLAAAAGNAASLAPLIHAAAGRLAVAVTTEGGIGHLMATRNLPLITLAGPTNAIKWKPVTETWRRIASQDFGSRRMEAIPVDAVLNAVAELARTGA